MSEEEINRAIADYCGWSVHHGGKYVHPRGERFRNVMVSCVDTLDAMQEAENWFYESGKHNFQYEREIRRVTLRDANVGTGLDERLIRATARQRAEAFLRTIGKWQEVAGLEPAK